jgi:hypothetical protein
MSAFGGKADIDAACCRSAGCCWLEHLSFVVALEFVLAWIKQ